MKGLCDLYIYDSANNLVGTVGYFYYSRLTIKELCTIYSEQGLRLRF